jgi:hypothetical protein
MDGYAVREEAEAGFFELAGEISSRKFCRKNSSARLGDPRIYRLGIAAGRASGDARGCDCGGRRNSNRHF